MGLKTEKEQDGAVQPCSRSTSRDRGSGHTSNRSRFCCGLWPPRIRRTRASSTSGRLLKARALLFAHRLGSHLSRRWWEAAGDWVRHESNSGEARIR